MAVTDTNTMAGPFIGDGSSTVFPFTFVALSPDEVSVVVDDATLPVGSYAVDLVSKAVVLSAPLSLGARLYIISDPSFEQQIQFENGSRWLADPVNEANDRAAIRAIWLRDRVARAPLAPLQPEDAAGLFPTIGGDGQWVFTPAGPGATGSSDNTYSSLAAFKASDISRLTASLVAAPGMADGRFNWTLGNFAGQADDQNIVKADSTALSVGAWVRQRADGLTYRAPAIAATPQSQAEKNLQTVDVFDALTPAMKADVRGGGRSVDCGPALQAIMNYAQGAESTGDAVGGCDLWFSPGAYLTSQPLTNRFRVDGSIVDDNDLRRMNVRGAGIANTAILYNGPSTSPAYSIEGYNGGTGRELYQVLEGLRLIRFPTGSAKVGIGLRGQHIANLAMRDVLIYGFDINAYLTDVLGFSSERLYLLAGKVGLRTTLIDWTNPNVWTMRDGAISGNSDIAAHFIKAANVRLDGVRFEGNGTGASSYSILCEGGSPEGAHTLMAENGYFENNDVAADIACAWGYPYDGIVTIRGNSFHKTSNTRYARHHVDLSVTGLAASAGSRLHVVHEANGYKTFGDYDPNPTRAVLRVQTSLVKVVESPSNLYAYIEERPQANNYPLIGNIYPVLSVTVNADGTYDPEVPANTNILSVTKTGTGVYRVAYRTPPETPLSVMPVASMINSAGSATPALGNVYVDVTTLDTAGNAADRAFSIVVFGRV